jgi:hypothetical protein
MGLVALAVAGATNLGGAAEDSEEGAGAAAVDKLMQQATFVFVGTVQKVQAATMMTVPVDARTTIVHVDEVVHSPATMTKFTGHDVTVQLAATGAAVKVGEKALFFTTSLQFGSSLALREVGRTGVQKDTSVHHKEIAAAVQLKLDRLVHARLTAATVVVSGKVTQVTVPTPAKKHPPDFDDPLWHDAHVQIDSVEKGKHAEKTIVVTFPSSKDIRWYGSPHFKVGDEGVFALHSRDFPSLGRQGMAALHTLDFHPKTELTRLRTLIKSGPGGPSKE